MTNSLILLSLKYILKFSCELLFKISVKFNKAIAFSLLFPVNIIEIIFFIFDESSKNNGIGAEVIFELFNIGFSKIGDLLTEYKFKLFVSLFEFT